MAIGASSQQGFDSFIGVAKEATFGTRVSVTAFAEWSSESFKRLDEENLQETMQGQGARDFVRRTRGNTVVDGSVELPLNFAADFPVLVIANGMGGSLTSTQVATTGSYSHTITVGDIVNGDVPSLSFTKRIGATAQQSYVGARVNSLNIKC